MTKYDFTIRRWRLGRGETIITVVADDERSAITEARRLTPNNGDGLFFDVRTIEPHFK